ncbi:MAG: 4-(cytidine 5'-diphospho)-2-C-methyl-D-erythritol kinase [Chloroflexota bacterium]|nr:4-(cytidine 5'-diphospho)-2-C-methyl-D-erythritol kinase [Chloroflexota bacterium]
MFSARPAAKLNLTLEVGEGGPDGFHELRSIFMRIGLSDRLSLGPGKAGSDRLVVSGLPGCPTDGNLVLRAVTLLREGVRQPLSPLDIELEKRIPIAAGLAGGSSDGAAALELAAACWGIGLAPDEKLALAATLGSDVPFFGSAAHAALIEGRGELVTPLPGIEGKVGLLLATPPVSISTAAAFARHDDLGRPAAGDARLTDELAAAFRAGLDGQALLGWATRLQAANDLWPAAVQLVPALATLRDALEDRTQRPWLLSGSGSTLFAFYPSANDAAADGAILATGRSADLDGAMLHATDLDGPDPEWRHP